MTLPQSRSNRHQLAASCSDSSANAKPRVQGSIPVSLRVVHHRHGREGHEASYETPLSSVFKALRSHRAALLLLPFTGIFLAMLENLEAPEPRTARRNDGKGV